MREGETPSHYRARKTCSKECAAELRVISATHKANNYVAGRTLAAPENGDIGRILGQGFAWFDKDPGDGGVFRVSRPATHIETASSLGWSNLLK
jgi:hypothetical protein